MEIPWDQILITAVTNFAFTSVLVGALAFVGRSLIGRWIDKDVESYKARLQATNAKELERFRADLKLATFEHETRFAKLHERRAEVIAELHKRLVQVERSLPSMESSEEKKSKTAIDNANEFWSYFEEHRIYLSADFCARITKLHETFQEAYTELVTSPTVITSKHGSSAFDLLTQFTALYQIREEIPQLRQEIEDDFRKMLGVD
jgi:hypothetical protein